MKRTTFVIMALVAAWLALPAAAQELDRLDKHSTVKAPYERGAVSPRLLPGGRILQAPTFYTDLMAWEAGCTDPVSPNVLNFETGMVAPGAIIACASPMTWAAGGLPCVSPMAPDSVHPDLTWRNFPVPRPANGIYMVSPGPFGSPSKAIGANFFVDSFRAEFSPGTTCYFSDVRTYIPASTVNIQVFDTGGMLLGTDSVFATNAGTPWGVTSGTPIGSIDFFSTANGAEGVDNARFAPGGGGDGGGGDGGGGDGGGGGDCDLDPVLDALDAIEAKLDDNLDVEVSSRASQDSVDAIEGKLDDDLDVSVSTRASQASVDALEVKIDALEVGGGNATQDSVDLLEVKADLAEAKLDSIHAKVGSIASQESVDALEAKIDTFEIDPCAIIELLLPVLPGAPKLPDTHPCAG